MPTLGTYSAMKTEFTGDENRVVFSAAQSRIAVPAISVTPKRAW
jgi:hypothetical protein